MKAKRWEEGLERRFDFSRSCRGFRASGSRQGTQSWVEDSRAACTVATKPRTTQPSKLWQPKALKP